VCVYVYVCARAYAYGQMPPPTHTHTQGDQKVSVHLMITIQKVTSNVQTVIPNSNYVIMVGERNCLKHCIFARFCTVAVRRTDTF
jgi:hypothetical protein